MTIVVLLLTSMGGGTTMRLSAQTKLPFVPTSIVNGKFAPDTHWYTIYVRSHKYLFADAASGRIFCSTERTPTSSDQAYLWTFTGNDDEGYRMYNYSTGPDAWLSAESNSDGTAPTLSGGNYCDRYIFSAVGSGFYMRELDTRYILNDKGQGGVMAYWNNTLNIQSSGSTMVFAEIEPEVTETTIGDPHNLLINEIQVANIDQYLDPGINYGGWIELYNPTDDVINLGGLYVKGTDMEGEEKLFHLRSDYGKVPSHGFRNIWFDHNAHYDNKEEKSYKAYHQVEWKLDYKGGTIAILDSDGTTELCSATYPAALPRTSYARRTDGGELWAWHACGTPETSNDGERYYDTPQRLDAPKASRESCVYTGNLSTTVVIPDGVTLRYTTDGSAPTASSAISTDGTFYFNANASLRLRFFSDDLLPSAVTTYSYIKKSSEYKLPILAITTSDGNFNDTNYGIFSTYSPNGRLGYGASHATNRNMEWERPVNFEYFALDSGDYRCMLNQEADFAVCGGWSRNSSTPPPFKIKAAEQYEGNNYLQYSLIPGKFYNKNRTLQLRRETDIKDAAVQEIVRRSGLHLDTQGWQPAQVFFNGQYQGYIPIREPNNKHFALANYGIDGDEIDVFEIHCDSNYVQSTGTDEAYWRWYELAGQCGKSDAAYAELTRLVDVEEFLNYMSVELYIGNNDWPWNNVKAFRSRKDGKFHMVLMDIGDRFCSADNPFGEFYNYQYPGRFNYDELTFVTIFINMMQNEHFRRQFVDTFCLVAGSVFDYDHASEVVSDMVAQLKGLLSTTGSTITSNLGYRAEIMISRLLDFKDAKVSKADAINVSFSSYNEGVRFTVNGLTVPTNRFRGTLFGPVRLVAAAPAGYVFEGWRQNYGSQYFSTDEAITLEPGQDYGTLIAEYRYDGTQPPVRINEVSPANNIYVCTDYWKRNDWVELINTTDHEIDVEGMYLTDRPDKPQKWQIPGRVPGGNYETIIPPHGTLVVWCDKLDENLELHAGFKLDNDDNSQLVLTAADGSWSDTFAYNRCNGDQTFGRFPDGADTICLMDRPTIGAPNHLSYFDYPRAIPCNIRLVTTTVSDALNGRATTIDVESAAQQVLRAE